MKKNVIEIRVVGQWMLGAKGIHLIEPTTKEIEQAKEHSLVDGLPTIIWCHFANIVQACFDSVKEADSVNDVADFESQ